MIKIQFSRTNDDFCDADSMREIAAADIVRRIADEIERGSEGSIIRDKNGNTIGEWSAEND